MICGRKNEQVRYSNSPIKQKMKFGGTRVVSRALVKEGVTNLVPKSSRSFRRHGRLDEWFRQSRRR